LVDDAKDVGGAPSNQVSDTKVQPDQGASESAVNVVGGMNLDRSRSVVGSQAGADWITAEGYFENGKIVATVPKVDNFDPEVLTYSVDVALNGQQFTGKAVAFRYYDI